MFSLSLVVTENGFNEFFPPKYCQERSDSEQGSSDRAGACRKAKRTRARLPQNNSKDINRNLPDLPKSNLDISDHGCLSLLKKKRSGIKSFHFMTLHPFLISVKWIFTFILKKGASWVVAMPREPFCFCHHSWLFVYFYWYNVEDNFFHANRIKILSF